MDQPVVVVGNGVSGYACAARLAERGTAVTMIGPGLPHDRPPLSKRAITTGKVPFYADAAKLDELGIEHLDGLVTEADLDDRRLVVTPTAADRETIELHAGRIVWATGFEYPSPPIPDVERVAIRNHTASGLDALHRAVDGGTRRVVVVGAGLIGTETAATLAAAGHQVTLVDMLERPLARLHESVSQAATATIRTLGITFLGECRIDAADPDAGALRTSSHGDVPYDVLVTAAGFRSSLPEDLRSDERALTVDVDERLRVIGLEDVWACGDCIAFPHPRYGRISVPHWDNAIWSGRHAAESLLGSTEPYVREPYYFSDIGPLRIQQVGLAAAATGWSEEDGWIVGRDDTGRVAAVVFMNAPARLAEARALVAGA